MFVFKRRLTYHTKPEMGKEGRVDSNYNRRRNLGQWQASRDEARTAAGKKKKRLGYTPVTYGTRQLIRHGKNETTLPKRREFKKSHQKKKKRGTGEELKYSIQREDCVSQGQTGQRKGCPGGKKKKGGATRIGDREFRRSRKGLLAKGRADILENM